MTARTDLGVVDNEAMNADRYIRNILEEHVVPFAPYIGDNFIFMDDNASPHRARIVQEYFEEVEVSRMNGQQVQISIRLSRFGAMLHPEM